MLGSSGGKTAPVDDAVAGLFPVFDFVVVVVAFAFALAIALAIAFVFAFAFVFVFVFVAVEIMMMMVLLWSLAIVVDSNSLFGQQIKKKYKNNKQWGIWLQGRTLLEIVGMCVCLREGCALFWVRQVRGTDVDGCICV